MANIGFRKPIAFPMTANKTYGTAMVVGKGVSCSITANSAEGSLYGDDALAEYSNGFTNADVTLGTTTIPADVAAGMFGHTKDADSGEITFNKDDQAIYVGLGLIGSEVIDNTDKYTAIFLYKVKFAEPSQEYETKGDSISYKTPSITGKATPDDDGDWKITKSFDTVSAALSWIYTQAGQTPQSNS